MDFPRVGHVRDYLMTERDGFKEMVIKRQYGWLAISIVVYVSAIVLGVSLVVNAAQIITDAYQKYIPQPQEEIIPHPKTLSYTIGTTTKDSDGVYHTNFLISVYVRAGDGRDTVSLFNNFPLKDSVCHLAQEPIQQSEYRGGLASTTYTYFATCFSREKIIDTGNLFKVAP